MSSWTGLSAQWVKDFDVLFTSAFPADINSYCALGLYVIRELGMYLDAIGNIKKWKHTYHGWYAQKNPEACICAYWTVGLLLAMSSFYISAHIFKSMY